MTEDASLSEDTSALFGKTMNCDEAVHQLYHYLDGELTDERRGQIAEHLNFCAPCEGAMEFEAELRQVIANRCKDHVPESLIRRIAGAIDEESRQHNGEH
jgi:mycothiol system anti-sigma-R factor